MRHLLVLLLFVSLTVVPATYSQVATKWMAVGAINSWFAETGSEIEEGRVKVQQDGLQWPAIYRYQDSEAAKGLWIGATNFTDEAGRNFPHKVVHVGPRVSGAGEFYPMTFRTVSQFDQPLVTVDGVLSLNKDADIQQVDATLKADRMILNVANTSLGITMTRKILAFSQGFHDNYFVYEYVFKNTGDVNATGAIELPNQTLTGVYFYFQNRYAMVRETRYVIGNSSGWGINTMNDTRGDGLNPASTFFPGNRDNDVRAQYAWHGKHPSFTAYDNIGAPIFQPDAERFVDRADSVGRLGAPHFVGVVTLHADKSATDKSDDLNQPSTTTYESSDDPLNSGRSPDDSYNPSKMTNQYAMMSRGRMSPRHADKVGPTGDPSQGFGTSSSSGGQSSANGYGPYTLAPGDSIRIVIAEGVAALSRERATSIGKRYKASTRIPPPPFPESITAAQKNDSVYTGRDSLFQTFRRAIANYQLNYAIPTPPRPPKTFTVTSGGDQVLLTWTSDDPKAKGFHVYRSTGRYDGDYVKIYEASATQRSYSDTGVVRGVGNFYYLVAVGDPADNTGGGRTPLGALTSSRYYTQTYDPAFLKRAAGKSMESLRIVPNPYVISSHPSILRFDQQPDKIAFFDIPGYCTIKIFTELGELIKTIEHTDGSGDESWNSITEHGQIIVSGVYIVHFTVTRDQFDSKGNKQFSQGETAVRKLVVIR